MAVFDLLEGVVVVVPEVLQLENVPFEVSETLRGNGDVAAVDHLAPEVEGV